MGNYKQFERCDDKPVLHTAGEVFPDGSILELIRIPNGDPSFLIWSGKSAATAAQFVRHGETFIPPRLDATIRRALRLPSNTAEYGSTRELFVKISNLISRTTQEADDLVQLVTFFVLTTWLIESLPVAPCLWIVSPPTTTPAPLMQVLGLLCRRALVVSDISATGVGALMDLQPTLMTEVFNPTRRLLNLLRGSSRHGALTALGGRFIDTCSAKLLFAREPLRGPESVGFPFELVLRQARGYVPLMSAAEAESIAAEFQAQLLSYRFRSMHKLRAPVFDLSQFTVPMREFAYSLGACVVDDDELQARIVPLLKPVDREIRVDHTSLLSAITLEVLLARCHTSTGRYVPVVELADDVSTVLRGRGEVLDVSPEKIGWVLRSLGLRTDFVLAGRKGLVLSNEGREKVHQLAAGYGVRTLRELPEKISCSLCAGLVPQLKPNATSEAVS